jgi:hypothetical protein
MSQRLATVCFPSVLPDESGEPTIAVGGFELATHFAVGEDYYRKIDYYDRKLEPHSPDPADPAVTVHVLTIIRVDEY